MNTEEKSKIINDNLLKEKKMREKNLRSKVVCCGAASTTPALQHDKGLYSRSHLLSEELPPLQVSGHVDLTHVLQTVEDVLPRLLALDLGLLKLRREYLRTFINFCAQYV